MKAQIIGLLAETSIHPGSGRSVGFVDLPVAREAATDFPVIVGSSVKGALRAIANREWSGGGEPGEAELRVFGQQDTGGGLIVSDARLAALPVRSLTGSYKWVTCPLLVDRLRRDLDRSGSQVSFPRIEVTKGCILGSEEKQLFLEERQFDAGGALPEGLVESFESLIVHESTRERVKDTLVVLHDDDFAWFARYGLAITARNSLSDDKVSENLWYEETLPADSLFYCLLVERGEGALEKTLGLLAEERYLQLGGNETVGQGWFAVQQEVSA